MLKQISRKVGDLLGIYQLKWNKRPNGIYCFNYHRIGDKSKTSFDPNVFSCDSSLFEEHIKFFKYYFVILDTEQLIELIDSGKPIDDKYAVITFDDGYIDNYTLAYPILKKLSCPAIMYIATDFISQQILPWWDEVAWLVKNNDPKDFIGLPWGLPKNMERLKLDKQIQLILRAIKDNKNTQINEKLQILRSKANKNIASELGHEKLFMDWDMIKEMSRNVVDIGSQTCSHRILSHLTNNEQEHEIIHSKALLEEKTNEKVISLAYPVGGHEAYNETTIGITKSSGYKFAFTFIADINKSIDHNNRFTMSRFSIDNQCSINEIKQRICKYIE
ncbi:MAG: peptidoglycan/xylan/chitin deacetylase (PgdA/CDA1 family) [Alteromonadaceae bacterium]|jgi:peptidoglycan/xylan/chitin deacetylase (PgdA/CDA1 family)